VSESLEGDGTAAGEREVNLGVLEVPAAEVGGEVLVGLCRGVLCGPLTGLDLREEEGVAGVAFLRVSGLVAEVTEGEELRERELPDDPRVV
jgi:hypothetical protein